MAQALGTCFCQHLFCSLFWEVQGAGAGQLHLAQAVQAKAPGSPIELSLQLHNLSIWDVIIFLNIPIKLSLIILVTIPIASIRAEIGRGFMAHMNLRATSVLRQESQKLLPAPAMNPAAKCSRFQCGLGSHLYKARTPTAGLRQGRSSALQEVCTPG